MRPLFLFPSRPQTYAVLANRARVGTLVAPDWHRPDDLLMAWMIAHSVPRHLRDAYQLRPEEASHA